MSLPEHLFSVKFRIAFFFVASYSVLRPKEMSGNRIILFGYYLLSNQKLSSSLKGEIYI